MHVCPLQAMILPAHYPKPRPLQVGPTVTNGVNTHTGGDLVKPTTALCRAEQRLPYAREQDERATFLEWLILGVSALLDWEPAGLLYQHIM